jgi:hypothetical protein
VGAAAIGSEVVRAEVVPAGAAGIPTRAQVIGQYARPGHTVCESWAGGPGLGYKGLPDCTLWVDALQSLPAPQTEPSEV